MSGTLERRHPRVSLEGGLGWAAAAIRHAGWWLAWQTRVRAGDGCREIDVDAHALTPQERAA